MTEVKVLWQEWNFGWQISLEWHQNLQDWPESNRNRGETAKASSVPSSCLWLSVWVERGVCKRCRAGVESIQCRRIWLIHWCGCNDKLVAQLGVGGIISLIYLHLVIRCLSHDCLDCTYPSSLLQTINWGFFLAPLKALRKLVGPLPPTLLAQENTWYFPYGCWSCGFEQKISWALNWIWSVVTHGASTWMGPSEFSDGLWYE